MSEKDVFHMAYKNNDRILGVKFEGFGVNDINELPKHPDYQKWCDAVLHLAKEIFDLE